MHPGDETLLATFLLKEHSAFALYWAEVTLGHEVSEIQGSLASRKKNPSVCHPVRYVNVH